MGMLIASDRRAVTPPRDKTPIILTLLPHTFTLYILPFHQQETIQANRRQTSNQK